MSVKTIKKKTDMYFGDNHSTFPYFYVYKISCSN